MARISRLKGDVPISEKLLHAALAEFGEIGYERANMKAIAERSGVTPAAIYYHFKNKQELLFKSLEHLMLQNLEGLVISNELMESDPRLALRQLVRYYIHTQLVALRTQAPMYNSLVHGTRRQRPLLSPVHIKRLRTLEDSWLSKLKSILGAGRDLGIFSFDDPTVTAFAIIGMCEHTINWVDPKGRLGIEQLADAFVSIAFRIAGDVDGAAGSAFVKKKDARRRR